MKYNLRFKPPEDKVFSGTLSLRRKTISQRWREFKVIKWGTACWQQGVGFWLIILLFAQKSGAKRCIKGVGTNQFSSQSSTSW